MSRRRSKAKRVALLLDEVHAPLIAARLRERGHHVTAVAETPELRAMSDAELFAFGVKKGRRIVTENVKDFLRLLLQSEEKGETCCDLLFTSSRSFPRSRRDPGPLIDALDASLKAATVTGQPIESSLRRS